jgi:hypothetical protein
MSNNIILTLTTVPNRLLEPQEHMGARHGIKTLLEQTGHPYTVHLNIPNKYRITGEDITLPGWLSIYQEKYPHLQVYRTEDYGPITKILPTLERVTDPDTIIITTDDDLYYMDGMISAHIQHRNRYPNYAIGFAGLSAIDGSCHFCTTIRQDTRVKILEGYKSVSYMRSFFDLDELKSNFIGKSWNDDYVLSAYMGFKNIPKIVIAHTHDDDFSPRVESFPVVGHTPIERGGCHELRNSQEYQKMSEPNIAEFYRLQYLER